MSNDKSIEAINKDNAFLEFQKTGTDVPLAIRKRGHAVPTNFRKASSAQQAAIKLGGNK